jgi:hypothetical protein
MVGARLHSPRPKPFSVCCESLAGRPYSSALGAAIHGPHSRTVCRRPSSPLCGWGNAWGGTNDVIVATSLPAGIPFSPGPTTVRYARHLDASQPMPGYDETAGPGDGGTGRIARSIPRCDGVRPSPARPATEEALVRGVDTGSPHGCATTPPKKRGRSRRSGLSGGCDVYVLKASATSPLLQHSTWPKAMYPAVVEGSE